MINRDEIYKWLIPLDFKQIFAINHPTPTLDEVHYIKDRTRIIIKKDGVDQFFYFCDSTFLKDDLTEIKSTKYKMDTDVNEMFKKFKNR